MSFLFTVHRDRRDIISTPTPQIFSIWQFAAVTDQLLNWAQVHLTASLPPQTLSQPFALCVKTVKAELQPVIVMFPSSSKEVRWGSITRGLKVYQTHLYHLMPSSTKVLQSVLSLFVQPFWGHSLESKCIWLHNRKKCFHSTLFPLLYCM